MEIRYTTFEEGQKLVELGMNTDTADICFYAAVCDERGYVLKKPKIYPYLRTDESPMTKMFGWSAEALIDEMRKRMAFDINASDKGYVITVGEKTWENDSLLYAIYEATCWYLKEQNLKK